MSEYINYPKCAMSSEKGKPTRVRINCFKEEMETLMEE